MRRSTLPLLAVLAVVAAGTVWLLSGGTADAPDVTGPDAARATEDGTAAAALAARGKPEGALKTDAVEGRILVHVLDADGRPAAGVPVEVVRVDGATTSGGDGDAGRSPRGSSA